MSFADYSTVPLDNTDMNGIYVGPDMERNNVRLALQQLMADGRSLFDLMSTTTFTDRYYATVAEGAAATSAPETFISDESGTFKLYDHAGVVLMDDIFGASAEAAIAAWEASFATSQTYTVGTGGDYTTLVQALDFLKTQPLNRPVTLTLSGAHTIPVTGYMFDHPNSRNLHIVPPAFTGAQGVISNGSVSSTEATALTYVQGRYNAIITVTGNGTDDISGTYGLAFPNGIGSIKRVLFVGNGHTRYLLDLGYNGGHPSAVGNSSALIEDCAFFDSVWGILGYGAQVTLVGTNWFGYQISGGPIGLFASTLELGVSVLNCFSPAIAAYALSPKYAVYADGSTLYCNTDGFANKINIYGQFLHGLYAHHGTRGTFMSANFDRVTQPITIGYGCEIKGGTPNIDNADPANTSLTVGGGQPGTPGNEAQGALIAVGCDSSLMLNGATIDDCIAFYYLLLQGGKYFGYGTIAIDGSKATTNALQVSASKGSVAYVAITNPISGSVDQCVAQQNGDIFFFSRAGMTVSPAINTPTNGSGNYE